MIRNPVLPGLDPDPSICRAGSDHYIATSTFGWYPGVPNHRRRGTVNWNPAVRPWNRASQVDMRGDPDSCGFRAPGLSHADGLVWLVSTDLKGFDVNFKDAHDHIMTEPAIEGPWSDPPYVCAHGFDPSLFHDTDGKKYILVRQWNHASDLIGAAPRPSAFDGILLLEWHPKHGLTGPIRKIFAGSDPGLTEGPHLCQRDGWVYLTVAEGGTGCDRAVTMARSRDIWGPYELHPDTHLITAKSGDFNGFVYLPERA